MNFKLTILIICCLTIVSCRQEEKSREVMEEAMDVYLLSGVADSASVEKSMMLTNRALELDDQNLAALSHKQTLLFIKRDIDGLLKTTDNLMQLMPEKPYYPGQKALYLELVGDTVQAREYYDKSIGMYQERIKTGSPDFSLMTEYVSILRTSGDTTLAKQTLERMTEMNFDESQKEIIDVLKTQSFSKQKLRRYLEGEIRYEQIDGTGGQQIQ